MKTESKVSADLWLCAIVGLVFLWLADPAEAKHLYKESWYRDQWCVGRGEIEVVLPDNTRCDCLTDLNAVEVDFAPKFYEAIGQALYYSLQTGKRGGVLLIMEEKSDYKYWIRLNSVVEHFGLPIDTWSVGGE